MNAVNSMLAAVPGHVPAERVFDFDMFHDPSIAQDIHEGLRRLHAEAPDIFWTPRNGGHWVATRFADVTEVMTMPEVFSSVDAVMEPHRPRMNVPMPPQDMDAPDHLRHRLLLLPFLSAKAVRKLEPRARALISRLLDALEGRRSCNFMAEIAFPMPVTIFLEMMQFDMSRREEFIGWVGAILRGGDRANIHPAVEAMNAYLGTLINERQSNPGDDPVSLLLNSEVNGEPLSAQRVREMCNLLMVAALDTVPTAMTFFMKYLAENPRVQQQLRSDPAAIPQAVEELLRRFAFVNMPRLVKSDYDLGGVLLRAGDTIVCSMAAASNDSRVISQPELVDFERRSQHLAFNTGPHNCAGAPLARLELRIFLEEWLRRMPDVAIAPDFVPRTRGGAVMALTELPIIW